MRVQVRVRVRIGGRIGVRLGGGFGGQFAGRCAGRRRRRRVRSFEPAITSPLPFTGGPRGGTFFPLLPLILSLSEAKLIRRINGPPPFLQQIIGGNFGLGGCAGHDGVHLLPTRGGSVAGNRFIYARWGAVGKCLLSGANDRTL